jgi:hypothetical protein
MIAVMAHIANPNFLFLMTPSCLEFTGVGDLVCHETRIPTTRATWAFVKKKRSNTKYERRCGRAFEHAAVFRRAEKSGAPDWGRSVVVEFLKDAEWMPDSFEAQRPFV